MRRPVLQDPILIVTVSVPSPCGPSAILDFLRHWLRQAAVAISVATPPASTLKRAMRSLAWEAIGHMVSVAMASAPPK